jgi:transcriptional regulator with XRE-family HTH domain
MTTDETTPERVFNEAMGGRLRQLIDALGLTYVQAAKEMTVSKQRLNNWLEGKAPPNLYVLHAWMRRRALADVNWIVWGDWSALPIRVAGALNGAAAPGTSLDRPEP